jgi:hypothetical protein
VQQVVKRSAKKLLVVALLALLGLAAAPTGALLAGAADRPAAAMADGGNGQPGGG